MVDYEIQGHVAVLKINRPDKKNAVNGDVARGMEAGDRPARGGSGRLARGAHPQGQRVLRRRRPQGHQRGSSRRAGHGQGRLRRHRRPQPAPSRIIAAVDGPALAGGTEIVLSCDLVVASTAASLRHPRGQALAGGRGRRAVPPAPGAAPQHRPRARADRRSRSPPSGPTTSGWSTSCASRVRRSTRALALAERIAANAPVAVRETRRLMLELRDADDETGVQRVGQVP